MIRVREVHFSEAVVYNDNNYSVSVKEQIKSTNKPKWFWIWIAIVHCIAWLKLKRIRAEQRSGCFLDRRRVEFIWSSQIRIQRVFSVMLPCTIYRSSLHQCWNYSLGRCCRRTDPKSRRKFAVPCAKATIANPSCLILRSNPSSPFQQRTGCQLSHRGTEIWISPPE